MIGILNIVKPVIEGLLLVSLFLGLGALMARANGMDGTPTLIFMIIIILGLGFLVITVFRVIAAIALMKGRPWARIVIVVFAVLGIFSFPLGTALSIYTLWALIFRENAGLYFMADTK